jgi:hypothetical protein
MSDPIDFDHSRYSVISPGGRYRYQLVADEDGEIDNMMTVWCRRGPRHPWEVEVIVHIDDHGGPGTIGFASRRGPSDRAKLDEDYMRAAGHIWCARQAGLWALEDGQQQLAE